MITSLTGADNCLGLRFKGVFPQEAGSKKDTQAGPLTALPFFVAVEVDEENLVKSCSNYLG
jgi:hypothetical protein